MSSTYSPDLRIELIGTGDQAGVWGNTTNTNLSAVLESAIAGYTSVSVIAANQAFTAFNGSADEARYAAIALTTTTGANFAVYAPPASKLYVIYNASANVATIYNSTVIGNTTAAGTGVAIPAGKVMTVWSDGTNFAQQNTHLTSPSFTTPALGTPASGTLTNATGLPIDGGTTGTLPVLRGGTGVTTSTGSGNTVLSTSPTLVTPILGTPTSATLTNATGLPIDGGTTGTLPVSRGGTGAVTLTANNVLLGNGTSALQAVAPGSSGNLLTSNGTTWTSASPPAGGVTSVVAGGGITVSSATGAVTISQDFYTGTSQTNTSYPIGSYVFSTSFPSPVNGNRNATVTPYIGTSSSFYYNVFNDQYNGTYATTAVAGTWRIRGATSLDTCVTPFFLTGPKLLQRVA
jgi:hypothetical protein